MEAQELKVGQHFKTSDSAKSWEFITQPRDATRPDKVMGRIMIDNFLTSQVRCFELHDPVLIEWACDFCGEKQDPRATQHDDCGDKICNKCERRRQDAWDDVVHIPSMP